MREFDVEQCLIPQLTAAGYHYTIDKSAPNKGLIQIRLTFWNEPDFRLAYQKILAFCYDNDGYIAHTSLINTAVTLLARII